MNERYGRIATATKSIDLPQYPNAAWTWYGGKPGDPADSLVPQVAWLYRAIAMISQCLADLPFALTKGETDVDTSDDWQNKVGFLPDPKMLLWKTAAALQRYGKAYHLRERTIGDQAKVLRYLMPETVTHFIDPLKGLTHFERQVGSTVKKFEPVKDIIYFWLPDSAVEVGPPEAWPAKSALASAGVLHSVDVFASGFFENGAIKATIMPVPPNMPQGEQERVEKKLRKLLTSVRNAFRLVVLGIGENGKPVVIGEGLEALKDAGAITRAREDVTAGFGISLAMILSSEANFATAVEDRKTLYTNTVIPLANFIAEVWNEQVFKALGYKWVFRPESMEIFQEDENSRAASLGTLSTALADPETFLISAAILGYDLSPEVLKMIDALIAKKEEERTAMAESLAQKPADEAEPDEEPEPEEDAQAQEDFAKWKRKSLSAVRRGKSADVEFISDAIPASQMASIKAALAQAITEDEVRAAFVVTPAEKVTAEQILEGIRLGVEALKHE